MGFIKEDDSKFPVNVRQIEPGDSVIGGPNGPINLCLKDLVDRTGFLKKTLDASIEDIGKKANQSDLTAVKGTADSAFKNSSNNAVNINAIEKRLNDADVGMKSSVLSIDDFDNIPEITQSYTLAASAIKNGPFSGGFTGTIQVLKRLYSAGDELIVWAHAASKTYKRVRSSGIWGAWSIVIESSNISHATNGASKDKVASEFALGEVNKTISEQGYAATKNVTLEYLFNNPSNGIYYTVDLDPKYLDKTPEGRVAAYVQVINQHANDGRYLTLLWRYASGTKKSYEIRKEDRIWTTTSRLLRDDDISHVTNGAAKDKVASEFALGEINKDVQSKGSNTINITAGNGLTGGGNLQANRTITLGTPSTITSTSTNTVNTNTHSHAIDAANLDRAGIARLSNATNSTSNDMAATPSAVKAAYDLANGKASKGTTLAAYGITDAVKTSQVSQSLVGTSKVNVASEDALRQVNAKVEGITIPVGTTAVAGIVKLNSATNSTLTSEAATPSAVKEAYDLANGRATKAYVDNAVKGIDLSPYAPMSQTIGFGQTRVNVQTQRSSGATYTNNTGRPIEVCVGVNGSSSNPMIMRINGMVVFSSSNSITHSISAIVNNGDTYSVGGQITSWTELR